MWQKSWGVSRVLNGLKLKSGRRGLFSSTLKKARTQIFLFCGHPLYMYVKNYHFCKVVDVIKFCWFLSPLNSICIWWTSQPTYKKFFIKTVLFQLLWHFFKYIVLLNLKRTSQKISKNMKS